MYKMNVYRDLTQLVGRTPMIEAPREPGALARVLLKLEYFNPGGSVKDRVALSMIVDAERSGRLRAGATIIEPTSGNTGVGLAWVGAVRGYNVILTMPDTMSLERRNLLRAYGARLELTPGAEGMKGAIDRAEQLEAEIDGAVILGQFVNPANPKIHQETTGIEIFDDTGGMVDVFVAGAGTGGTVTGVGRALRSRKPEVEIIAVEPASSAVLSTGVAGKHKIQGIGAGFVPEVYDSDVVSRVLTVTDEDAMRSARALSRRMGLLAGISSGAAYAAAARLATLPEYDGKNIVALLPDTGERYLSTGIFD